MSYSILPDTDGATADTNTNSNDSANDNDNNNVERAWAAVHSALEEEQLLLEQANASKDYDSASFYLERVKHLSSVLSVQPQTQTQSQSSTASISSSLSLSAAATTTKGSSGSTATYECPVPGLLLRMDRFAGTSDAFLGRGSSGAVSKGVWVQVVGGQKEVRTQVAVKEVPRTGLSSEQQVMRELLLLKQKLRAEVFPNIIRVYDVAQTSNTFYVILQCCNFSLAKQPPEFQEFLHSKTGKQAGRKAGKQAHVVVVVVVAFVPMPMPALVYNKAAITVSVQIEQWYCISGISSSHVMHNPKCQCTCRWHQRQRRRACAERACARLAPCHRTAALEAHHALRHQARKHLGLVQPQWP